MIRWNLARVRPASAGGARDGEGSMNIRTRPVALAIMLLLLCSAAAWGFGGREDPLLYADKLISEQKYDEAILYLTDFMKNNPDRFDAAQARLRKITRIRSPPSNKTTSANHREIKCMIPRNACVECTIICRLSASFRKS